MVTEHVLCSNEFAQLIVHYPERFFRTLKQDLIYRYEFESPRELRSSLEQYMADYNTYRPHSAVNA